MFMGHSIFPTAVPHSTSRRGRPLRRPRIYTRPATFYEALIIFVLLDTVYVSIYRVREGKHTAAQTLRTGTPPSTASPPPQSLAQRPFLQSPEQGGTAAQVPRLGPALKPPGPACQPQPATQDHRAPRMQGVGRGTMVTGWDRGGLATNCSLLSLPPADRKIWRASLV